jgi:hypothetical protein
MWENIVEPDGNTAHEYRMLIPKATKAHSEYVIIIAFPLNQWLQEHALMLRYTYIACLVMTRFVTFVVFFRPYLRKPSSP